MAAKRRAARAAKAPKAAEVESTEGGAAEGTEDGRVQLRWNKARNQALVAAIHDEFNASATDEEEGALPVAERVAEILTDDPAFTSAATEGLVTAGRVAVHVRLLRRKLTEAGEYSKLVKKLGHKLALGRTGGGGYQVSAADLLEGIGD
jgi:hypothetical protein